MKTYIQSKPRVGSAEKDLAIFPLTEVCDEVSPACLGHSYTLGNFVGVMAERTRRQDVLNIHGSLLHIAIDIHGETRGFWDGETEVESNATRYTAQSNQETPTKVDMVQTIEIVGQNRILVGSNDDKCNQSGS